MRRERPVLRRPQPWGYQSEELQRLEARAWGLMCGEEWGTLESLCGSQRLMDAPPGSGLLALRTKSESEERFERETRMTLFGALQHTRTSDMDIRLDLPPVPSNIDVTGLTIRVCNYVSFLLMHILFKLICHLARVVHYDWLVQFHKSLM